ncbi:hypothetical protein [uncultured Acinetobacter sp.]|uniref:Bbp19 family protein n=1 Tax=uncultured Acinetobacter sp. TaxID=165433 RepID=UPI0025F6A3E3|nr:hypothetical protein [uncultured Acinetobacter sp.]
MILISILAVICAIGCAVCGFGWFKSHRNLIEERLLNQSIRADTQSKIDESEEETGNLVRHRTLRKPRAETYRNVFDLDINGQRILEDLTGRFCKSTYVRGGQDAERESCYRAGQSNVVNFIVSQINQANDPNYKESEE